MSPSVRASCKSNIQLPVQPSSCSPRIRLSKSVLQLSEGHENAASGASKCAIIILSASSTIFVAIKLTKPGNTRIYRKVAKKQPKLSSSLKPDPHLPLADGTPTTRSSSAGSMPGASVGSPSPRPSSPETVTAAQTRPS